MRLRVAVALSLLPLCAFAENERMFVTTNADTDQATITVEGGEHNLWQFQRRFMQIGGLAQPV
tara:strand:- start:152 stop:340 length:189 start_codon:yes stop_codon:yes gene_type:complete